MLVNVPEGYYIWFVLHPRRLVSPEKNISLLVSLLTKWMLHSLLILQLILTLFYMMYYWLLLAVLHRSAFSFDFWCHFLFLRLICDYLKIEFRYALLYWLFLWWLLENFHILPDKFPMERIIPFHHTLLVMKVGNAQLDWKYILATTL